MQTIQGDGFIVEVIKSNRRKTAALKIKHNRVSIHIPSRLPLKFAQDFVIKKTPWIQQKLTEQSQQAPIDKQFIEGENFLFLGQDYALTLVHAEKSVSVSKTISQLKITGRLNRLSKNTLRASIITWYKQQATLYLRSRTAKLAKNTEFKPKTITVKTYKARWGSCGVRGDLQYNWKLILAPSDIIDYVIIHELCHLVHHNHSALFWGLVKKHCPNFKQAQQWLKQNGYRLEV
ncbi:MAG: hypothetical protein COA90_05170 [Gammaproteobacteria bacterium]|nr:MAG: hypothetical protein COA90_05170 [Gammaproteobacteria bacterium]